MPGVPNHGDRRGELVGRAVTPLERWRGWIEARAVADREEVERECDFLTRVEEAFRVHRQIVLAPRGLREDAALAIVDAHRRARRS